MTPGDRVRRVGLGGDHQLGVIVETEDGKLAVRLDRGGHVSAEQVILSYKANQWEDAPEQRLQLMQMARVSYEADRALRIGRGEYSVTDWQSMREPARVSWSQNGPPKDDSQRRRLFEAVMGVLQK